MRDVSAPVIRVIESKTFVAFPGPHLDLLVLLTSRRLQRRGVCPVC